MRKLKLLTLTLAVVLLMTSATAFASTTKSTTVTDVFYGRHVEFGLMAWNITTIVYGTFGTYVDEKVIENMKLVQKGMTHDPQIGEGSISTTMRTYKGSTLIRTCYVPTGFANYSILIDKTTTHLYWSLQKALSDTGMRTVTMKVKANYTFFFQETYPLNLWSGEASVLY